MSEGNACGGPVMLALSTFRQSEKAVKLAFEKAQETGRLLIVEVADVNLARYFVGSDVGLFQNLKARCEAELLQQHEAECRERAKVLCERAQKAGLSAASHVETGRFGLVVMRLAGEYSPSCIVTTRSDRSDLIRRFFGSPVDQIKKDAACPVSVV